MKLSPTRFELSATMIALALAVTAVASTACAQQHSAAPVAASPAPTSAPVDVEPGVRFGALRLGMTRAQVIAAMPGIPLQPDTAEIYRADHSTAAFIGPYQLEFEASGELRKVSASLHRLAGGVRIGGRVYGPSSTPALMIAAMSGCGSRIGVGGGFVTRCSGISVGDFSTAAGLVIAVYR